ncbi:putative ankyrin repeat protein RF_0381 [Microplitis mediator]|uniref:putative ankyrin repeat protein RF_0381 n=1 Tax=Microplitis mediator TaxID=375433 RepID=UPI002553D4FA|nr:putative ankyrin repeat protein RF_0381 [Microplitis mediator]
MMSEYNLISAIRLGQFDRINEMIDSVDLSHCQACPYQYILLLNAVKKNQTNIVKLLLSKNFQVNYSSKKLTNSPLHWAVTNTNYEIIEMLLNNQADVNAKNQYGKTSLHLAIEKKNLKITELLINFGADINALTNHQETPLYIATNKLCLKMIKLLLNKQADVNAEAINGVTPLFRAVDLQSREIVEYLLENGSNINFVCKSFWYDGYTPLHLAAELGNEEIVKILLDRDANINAKTKNELIPIFVAAEKNHGNIVKVLLDHRAKLSSKNENGQTILSYSVKSGYLIIVEQILTHEKYYLDPDSTDNWGTPLLHLAARYNHVEIIFSLLKHAADINYKDQYGRTALHIATQARQIIATETLLDMGADINIEWENGHTPLDDANSPALCSKFVSYNNYDSFDSYDSTKDAFINEEIIEALNQHILKIKFAGFYVSEKNYQSAIDYYDNNNIDKYESECKLEIENLKSEKIRGSISLHDILTKNNRYLSLYAKNKTIVKLFESNEYELNFPIYGGIIYGNFSRGVRRNLLIDKIDEYGFDEIFYQLPIACIEEIISFLNENDLKIPPEFEWRLARDTYPLE